MLRLVQKRAYKRNMSDFSKLFVNREKTK